MPNPNRIAAGKRIAEARKLKDPKAFEKIGRKGGQVQVPKGFAMNKELASEMGKKSRK